MSTDRSHSADPAQGSALNTLAHPVGEPDDNGRSAVGGGFGGLALAVDHVGIAVPDLDVAVAFYSDVFGLVETHREVNVEQGVVEAMLAPASAPEGATQIQLLAPLTPASTIARFIDRSGPGLQQLAYRVADVEAAMAVLRSKGVRLLYDTAKTGTGGSKINFVHPKDAGGVLVELVEDAGTPRPHQSLSA